MFKNWKELILNIGVKELATHLIVSRRSIDAWASKNHVPTKYFEKILMKTTALGMPFTAFDFFNFNQQGHTNDTDK